MAKEKKIELDNFKRSNFFPNSSIVEINTIGKKYIKFINIVDNKVNEKTFILPNFYFKDNYVKNEDRFMTLLKNNIVNPSKLYVSFKQVTSPYQSKKLDNINILNKGKVLKTEVKAIQKENQKTIVSVDTIDNIKTLHYKHIDLEYFNFFDELLSKEYPDIKYVMCNQYIKYLYASNNQSKVIITKNCNVCTIYIFIKGHCINETEYKYSNSDLFVSTIAIFIDNIMKKEKINEFDYYVLDKTHSLQKMFEILGVKYFEI